MTAVLWIAGIIAILGALGVVAARTPVHGVLALVVNFLGLAALYLSLHAEFLAIVQIIIYAGAIMILFLFVIALLTVGKDPVERPKDNLEGQRQLGIAAAVVVGALLAVVALRGTLKPAAPELMEGFGSAAAFGRALLTTHVFPFELTAFALMAAVIGVVVLVGRKQQ